MVRIPSRTTMNTKKQLIIAQAIFYPHSLITDGINICIAKGMSHGSVDSELFRDSSTAPMYTRISIREYAALRVSTTALISFTPHMLTAALVFI